MAGCPSEKIDAAAYQALAGELLVELFPICRSITGDGLRATFAVLSRNIPLELTEVASGTGVFDWDVPDEWNIHDAFIADPTGRRVVDFRKSNLHVVGYSVPVDRHMTLGELRPHLHTLPDQPEAIPYLTSYYERTWGFCLAHRDLEALTDGEYHVRVDSTLTAGSLTLAEAVLPGETADEIFISTYCCHPSMANNELSGPIVATMLYRYLASLPRRRFTYRFHFGSETIGALAYLARRGDHLRERMHAGFVVTCCGDRGPFTYKMVRNPRNQLDPAVEHALRHSGVPFRALPFFPTGSDERQYSSPGFDLPVGSLMRSVYGQYPEYHTSLDNLDFVSAESLVETLKAYINCIYTLEHNRLYLNKKPWGEPRLGQYGLYHSLGGRKQQSDQTRRLRYILNYSDGTHDLLDIANRLGDPIWDCDQAVADLVRAGLLAVTVASRQASRQW
jgi:aminopeptidase-like protein